MNEWQNRVNHARGQQFEQGILAACRVYAERNIAVIDKTPEPFRVVRKYGDGMFSGRFTRLRAQPDFQGTLKGGRSIVFEAKYTGTDRIHRNVLTETQSALLQCHCEAGAVAGVCAGIREDCFFIPWEVWRDMKGIFGRQYVRVEDLRGYRVPFDGAVWFLGFR